MAFVRVEEKTVSANAKYSRRHSPTPPKDATLKDYTREVGAASVQFVFLLAHPAQDLRAMLRVVAVVHVVAQQRIRPEKRMGQVVDDSVIANRGHHQPQRVFACAVHIRHREALRKAHDLPAALLVEVQPPPRRVVGVARGHFNLPQDHVGLAGLREAFPRVGEQALPHAVPLHDAIHRIVRDERHARIAQQLQPHHANDVARLGIARHQQPQRVVGLVVRQSLKRDFFVLREVGFVDIADEREVLT